MLIMWCRQLVQKEPGRGTRGKRRLGWGVLGRAATWEPAGRQDSPSTVSREEPWAPTSGLIWQSYEG